MAIKLAATTAGLAGAIVLALAGFGRNDEVTTRSCGPVLDQEVCTWVTLDGAAVVELGATIPMALVERVPLDAEMTWPPAQMAAIPLPAAARTHLGLDHLGINWEAHGHPPAAFLSPHFDFHFYNVAGDALSRLDCADQSKPAAAPVGYALPDIAVPGLGTLYGLCVPNMGMHALPRDQIESAEPFTATMVLGYYAGKPIFFEPMVSRQRLLARSSFELEMPEVRLPPGVRYPSTLAAEYDPAGDQYRMVMRGFERR